MAAWLAPDRIRRYLQITLGIVAGFVIGTMAVQSWLAGREAERLARDQIAAVLDQGSVPLNLLFSETVTRLMALESIARAAPGSALRLDPGYRRYDAQGAPASGGPPIAAVAAAAGTASRTGYPAVSMPFEVAGLWYAAIVKERSDSQTGPVAYEGIQFPVSRILEWWSGAGLPQGSSVALLTEDGRIWLRDPFVPALTGTAGSADPFAGAATVGPGHLSRVVAYDGGGVDAIVGWRSLELFGLVYVVGVDRDQLPVPATATATVPLAIALLVTAGAFLVVTFTGRSATPPAPLQARPPPAAAYRAPPRAPAPDTPPAAASSAEGAPHHGLLAVAEKMPVVVYEQAVTGDFSVTFRYVSQGVQEVQGISPARLEAKPELMFDMVHEDDRSRVIEEHRKAWRSGADLDVVYRIVTPGAEEKWVHNLSRASRWTRSGEPSVWDGILFDVTAQKHTEQALQAARSEAELTSRGKAEFLANVSHELRTPLNAIVGFAEVIREETFGPVGVDKYVEYARDIHESADHLLAVVNDILDLSKIEAGRATLVLEDVEVAELVDSCLRLIHGRAADARLQLRRYVEQSLPRMRVDPLKVKQILINLLSNAVKFTRSGGTVTLRAAGTPEGGIALSVSDTGIGIAEKDMSKAIESYGQVEPADGVRSEGTGLGLPLAKALTELHGGELVIRSSAGKGTTVTAVFPPSCIASAKTADD